MIFSIARNGIMKILLDTNVLVSAAELGEAIGADAESINNWIRREVITRAPIGGRQIARHRLFKPEEVYRAAVTNELVHLRIPPSLAGDAASQLWKEGEKVELWKEWEQEVLLSGKNIYAVISPSGDSWAASLCWQNLPKGPLYRIGKRPTSKLLEEMELPKRAFAVIPLSEVFADVTKKLLTFLSDAKRHRTKDARS
jgi:hypothetical protein